MPLVRRGHERQQWHAFDLPVVSVVGGTLGSYYMNRQLEESKKGRREKNH